MVKIEGFVLKHEKERVKSLAEQCFDTDICSWNEFYDILSVNIGNWLIGCNEIAKINLNKNEMVLRDLRYLPHAKKFAEFYEFAFGDEKEFLIKKGKETDYNA